MRKSTWIRYDTIEEFNVDSKAESGQLNLAYVARIGLDCAVFNVPSNTV